jgi:hypothetical protein
VEEGESEQGVMSKFWCWYCTWPDEPRQDIQRSIKSAERMLFYDTRAEIKKNSPAQLFCFSKTSEPNLRHVRPPSSMSQRVNRTSQRRRPPAAAGQRRLIKPYCKSTVTRAILLLALNKFAYALPVPQYIAPSQNLADSRRFTVL